MSLDLLASFTTAFVTLFIVIDPILVTPIFATIFMLHLYKRLASGAAI